MSFTWVLLVPPYVLLSQNDFQTLTGQTGYRIISIDMKENATEAEYQELKQRLQALSETIPGTLLKDELDWQKSTAEFSKQYAALRNSIAAILIIISGLSIYNNMNYNLLVRTREYGIMKAIGLSDKQFRRMIQFEGIAYGSIAAFFACGIAFILQLCIFVYWAYINPYPLYLKQYFFAWQPYVLVIAINLGIGYISTLGPIYQVNKVSITEAIRSLE